MEVQVQASIMIVDDDSDVRLLLQDAMRAAGFDCVGAACGHQALEMLETFKADVVITDLRMPGMNGLELMSMIKSRCAVIVMTGFAEDLTADQVLGLGAKDFFHKPISIRELRLRLQRVIAELDSDCDQEELVV